MNCTTCRYELSQRLDGRLPSSRLDAVATHTAQCEGCAAHWLELQAAQRLVLALPRPHVGPEFRNRLWERIAAGEGTPEAVFREPLPLLTKARYALTGAAIAAAALLAAMWLQREPTAPRPETTHLLAQQGFEPRLKRIEPPAPVADSLGLVTAAQPLTADLVAVEAAKQFQQRYSTAHWSIERLALQPDDEPALRRLFESAEQLRDFGSLLLSLRDRERLSFHDLDADADLRVAVRMLDPAQLQQRSLATARNVVVPALRSPRLSNLVRTIRVQPSVDPREELDVLWRLNTQQPELFSRMFFVMGDSTELQDRFGMPRMGAVFLLQGQCGTQLVAPRSEVERAGLQPRQNR